MALSSHLTLGQIRAVVRRELLDPSGKFWANDEIDQYANDWNHILQSQFEFVWSTATLTLTSTATQYSLTTIASDIMRVDTIYYTPGGTSTFTGRLSPRSMADLDTYQRNWRGVLPANAIDPIIVYQQDAQSISLWPPPNGTGTVYLEYPVMGTMATSTSTMIAPAWTRYSVVPYVLYRAYARYAGTQDLGKASRRRKQWDNQLQLIRRFYDGYFPDKAEMLRPGRKWAGQILKNSRNWPVWS